MCHYALETQKKKIKKVWFVYIYVCIFAYTKPLKNTLMKAIVNRDSKFGWLDGKFVKNEEVRDAIFMHIKRGTAKKLIDTDTTLMYILGAQK